MVAARVPIFRLETTEATVQHRIVSPHRGTEASPFHRKMFAPIFVARGSSEFVLTAQLDSWVAHIAKVDVVEVLHEVIPSIKSALRLWLIAALLVFMRCKMGLIRMFVSTEWAMEEGFVTGVGVAADPSRPESVNRVLMTDPFVLGLEGARAKSAKERKTLRGCSRVVDSVDLCSTVW